MKSLGLVGFRREVAISVWIPGIWLVRIHHSRYGLVTLAWLHSSKCSQVSSAMTLQADGDLLRSVDGTTRMTVSLLPPPIFGPPLKSTIFPQNISLSPEATDAWKPVDTARTSTFARAVATRVPRFGTSWKVAPLRLRPLRLRHLVVKARPFGGP